MTKIATSRNSCEKWGNRYKLEEECFRIRSHCLEPIWVTLLEHIPSSFWTNDSEALFQYKSKILTAWKIYSLISVQFSNGKYFSFCLWLTSLLDASEILANCVVLDCITRLKTSGTYMNRDIASTDKHQISKKL